MNYEDDLSDVMWNEGWKVGYGDGREETIQTYEIRLAAFWTELATLNARIDYLEKLTGGFK